MSQTIGFTKMQGAGNDYIYVDTARYPLQTPEKWSVLWSDRHRGIGADGLVLIAPSPVPEADFSMRIFNADGSEARMCGNASRCIGKYVYERGLTQKREIRLHTLSGIKLLQLHVQEGRVDRVTVDMLEPVLAGSRQFLPEKSPCDGVFVSMGNPHFVVFTDDVDQVSVTGPKLEVHPAFPERCNIEFAQVCPDGGIRTRVWERGSGVTQACGTGACATAVAAALRGLASRKSRIDMDGGSLEIEWRESDNHVYMTGPAVFVFDGQVSISDTVF